MENNGYCTVNECPMRNANGYCMTTGCIKMSSLTNIPGAVRIVTQCELTPEAIEEIANAVVEKLKDRKWWKNGRHDKQIIVDRIATTTGYAHRLTVEDNTTKQDVDKLLKNLGYIKDKSLEDVEGIKNLPSAQESLYELLNEAHNEGYDVGYWAGRRDYEQKWIPVSERLPDQFTPVLVYFNRNSHNPVLTYFKVNKCNGMGVGEYYLDGDKKIWRGCGFIPTHWMPLPEPPSERIRHIGLDNETQFFKHCSNCGARMEDNNA